MEEIIKKEEIKSKKNKVFISYEKSKGKSPIDSDFDVDEWEPRNNLVILLSVTKPKSGLVLPDLQDNRGDTALFFLYSAGPNSGLEGKEGKAVVLRDYSVGLSIIPIKEEGKTEEFKLIDGRGSTIKTSEKIYYLCYEHNIVLIEK
jgi:hypothetical protein